MHIYIYVCVCVCVCVYIYIYIYIYILYVYVYIYILFIYIYIIFNSKILEEVIQRRESVLILGLIQYINTPSRTFPSPETATISQRQSSESSGESSGESIFNSTIIQGLEVPCSY